MKALVNRTEIQAMDGDISLLDTDAIVNAANEQLILGGGVAGAIRRRGGPKIQLECDQIGGTYAGGAVITGGGNLKAKYVIHAVGPRMGEGDEDQKLASATLNTLKLADEKGLRSLAFPAISTGIFGYPMDRCAKVMVNSTIKYLKGETSLARVVFCLFGSEALFAFEEELKKHSKDFQSAL